MKRAFDILACASFLLLSWPILLMIIIAIRLQTPGAAIFAQVRVGKSGRPFTCYKLRTMYSGTANLPTQLWNVLIGDMSLGGGEGARPPFRGQPRRGGHDARVFAEAIEPGADDV